MTQQTAYRIRVQGQLSSEWSSWFGGLIVCPEPEGTTLLTGRLPDQAALHGLLVTIRDLGLTLVSLDTDSDPPSPAAPVAADQSGAPDA